MYYLRTLIIDHEPPSSVVGPCKFDDGLNSAASTLASIVSRQAFDIPRAARGDRGNDCGSDVGGEDDGGGGGGDIGSDVGDRRSAGGRSSLPDIVGPAGDLFRSGVQVRRDSVGSGVRTRRQDTPTEGRDPFGSPVTPKMYNRLRYHAGNAQRAVAATTSTKTAAASS